MRVRLIAVLTALVALAVAVAAPSHAASGPCSARALDIWLDTQPGRTAGSTYYKLEFTNLSAHACTLRGYPGVSAITSNGRRIGSPAARNAAHPSRTVALSGGASAIAVLQVTDVHNFPPSACRPVTAAGLRVYAPGATRAATVPFPFLACSKAGTVALHAEAVERA
jgi:hypothetical protein